MSDPINNPAAPEPTPRLYALSALLPDFEAEATAAHEARKSGKARGPVSGLSVLDRELGGCFQTGVHALHAAPGAGKTALTWQMAATSGCPSIFVTCEMPPLEMLRRLTARVTETYLGRLKSGEIPPAEAMALVRRGIEAAPMLAMVDATRAYASPKYLRDTVAPVMRERHPDNPHLLIVIDSLHSWIRSGNSNLPEYEAINDGMLTLGRLATELSCPILVISERNRATMNDGGMSSGAGSRVIEYGSESVIELQPETDKETKRPVAFDGAGNRRVFVTFNKNRHGEPGKRVPLLWNGALQRFSEPKA